MLGRAALLQLALCTAAAHAFFPWFPPAVCEQDNALCKAQLATREAKAADSNGLTFAVRRAPHGAAEPDEPRDEPRAARVARTARRLARKHAHTHAARANDFAVVSAAAPAASNAVGIDQDGTDFSYFVEAAFGSAGTPLLMLLDTGAGTTWVMGSGCASTACTMHSAFGAADSATLQTTADTFSIAYGSGAVAGTLASDTVALTADLALTMSFGLANTTSDDFTHFPFDGILGLSLSEGVTDNFWKTAQAAGALAANVFGVALWRAANGGANTGEIVFGAADPSKYAGSLSYTPVSAAAGGDWAIAMDDMGYAGSKAGITGRLAYIDTGTTYVFGPPADVAALHSQIPGAASADGGVTYSVPCSSDQPLTVFFSGVAYSIASADWLAPAAADGANCTSNIYGHAVVADAWLLGDLFIKNVYAVFDIDQSRIGFAAQATSAGASASATQTGTATATGTPTSGTAGSSVVAAAATTTAAATASGGGSASLPGLSGHETAATAVAESSSAATPKSSSSAVTSPAGRADAGVYCYASLVCAVAALAMAL